MSPDTVVAGRYRIESYLAAGGMGEVYLARDLALDVPLALKTIRPEIATNPVALHRFKREVLLARSVTHPNVCRIFDIGQDEVAAVSFLTMEFLHGETLASRIKARGALSPEASLPLVCQMADALDAAHRAGIVHRDFKSANVMLTPTDNGDRAVIMDFGLAMSLEDRPEADRADASGHILCDEDMETVAVETPADVTGGFVGTPAYMSPEQVTGGVVGPASDLYALGIVLFEMATGRLPFQGATPLDTAHARLTSPPPRPSELTPLDPAWERTILRLLAREPSDRFETAHDVVLALEGRVGGKGTTPHSLRAERDVFVGRAADLKAIAQRLESLSPASPHGSKGGPGSTEPGPTRLLTLLGPGGTGKTRLAQKYGWESLARWPGGAWFCDLSEARSPNGIAQSVAASLNVPVGREDPIVQLGHAIAGRGRSLIILDNFEQVAAHAETTLGRWLERTTETRFLVTSRERLGLPEESVHGVEPLDPTTQGQELFELRAQAHHPGFRVDASNGAMVEDIVRRLEGLPLAIELAASRLRMLSLEQLRDRLKDRFKILAGGKHGRHATLAATLEWSWDLLEPWEQSAVAQASVFEGGFTLEAAEEIFDLAEQPKAPSVLDVVQSLVDKSWLRARVARGVPRFEMYVTVQEYASKRLRDNTATYRSGTPPLSPENVERRHGTYYAAMGTQSAIKALDRHDGLSRLAALHLELENLVSACKRAVDRGDPETAVGAFVASSILLAVFGPMEVGVALGEIVIGMPEIQPEQRARALRRFGDALRHVGRGNEARHRYEEAITLHREAGDRASEGVVLGVLGGLDYEQGRVQDARRHYEQALAIHREVGNRRSEGIDLGNLGGLDDTQGRVQEARRHYEEALAIHREVGNRGSEAVALANLGSLDFNQGRMQEGRRNYEEALAILRQVGTRRHIEGLVLTNLGSINLREKRIEEAQRNQEEALTIHREVGNRRSEGIALGFLGRLDHQQGRMEEAASHLEQAISILQAVGDRHELGSLICVRGELEHDQADLSAARASLKEAEAIAESLGVSPDSELERSVAKLRQKLSLA